MKTTNKPNNNALGNIATTYVDRQELESEATMHNQNPAVVVAVQKAEDKHRPCPYYFYGDAQREMTCPPVKQFPGISNLMELFAVLEQCWTKETAYPACQAEWVPNDPSYGQCAITAMLVHDMFGGTIHKIRVSGGGTHYFNKLNEQYVDLTREQFDLYDLPVYYEDNQEVPREFCGKNQNTMMRYRQLQRNMMQYLR